MNLEQALGIVRAATAAIGGYLVGRGVIDAGQVELITGAVIAVATAAWSVWSKRKA